MRVEIGDAVLICADNRHALPTLTDASVDSVVTDPPYELGFMGKSWDAAGLAFDPDFWASVARVLKPGGHLLAFGGTRTYHRMTCAIEDAGFEIRDCIMWVYGSGFPKSLDVSKAIDKAQRGGMVREKLMHFAAVRGVDGKWLEAHGVASASSFTDWTVGGHVPSDSNWQLVKKAIGVTPEEEAAFERQVIGQGHRKNDRDANSIKLGRVSDDYDITAPATDAARQWSGWGTAIKPACEPIVVARKPLCGTVAENVLKHGTGGINVDGCRVGTEPITTHSRGNTTAYGKRPGEKSAEDGGRTVPQNRPEFIGNERVGRWPANLIHDGSDEVVAGFPVTTSRAASDMSRSNSVLKHGGTNARPSHGTNQRVTEEEGYGDSGSAARFFYTAKASQSDRGKGNNHPTVKPLDLMRYLVRLVTPKGGLVLDPFLGSGTTGKAASLEGFRFIGIEREPAYFEIAKGRVGEGEGVGSLFDPTAAPTLFSSPG